MGSSQYSKRSDTQEARVAREYASSNSDASFELSKLNLNIISQYLDERTLTHEPIVKWNVLE